MKLAKKAAFGLLALGLAVPTLSLAADTGPELYKQKCAMCHGPNGEGGARKLAVLGSADVQKKSDSELKDVISKGTKGPHGTMPGYGSKLSPDQIDNIVHFVRSLKK